MINKRIKIPNKERGLQVLTYVLFLIFGILIYLGIISWRPILGYFYIKDTATDAVKPSYFKNRADYVPTAKEVRGEILKTAKKWKIPLKRSNIKIKRTKENVTAIVSYTWTFNIFGYEYVHRFSFTQRGDKVK